MYEAICRLEAEIDRLVDLSVQLKRSGLTDRAAYRKKEAGQLSEILTLLENEYYESSR